MNDPNIQFKKVEAELVFAPGNSESVSRKHDNNYQFKKNEIALVHLPKTAGTSLHYMLDQDKLHRFINFNIHRSVSQLCRPGEYQYITIMRDPAERVWSFYQMVLRSPRGYPYKQFTQNGFEDFVNHCWEVRNLACRFYSSDVEQEPDRRTVDKALSNLMDFVCIIDFDNFEEEAAGFCANYAIQVTSVPHERESSYIAYTQGEYDVICEHNEFDLELFAVWKRELKSPTVSAARPVR